jgi:hypothetical protein
VEVHEPRRLPFSSSTRAHSRVVYVDSAQGSCGLHDSVCCPFKLSDVTVASWPPAAGALTPSQTSESPVLGATAVQCPCFKFSRYIPRNMKARQLNYELELLVVVILVAKCA